MNYYPFHLGDYAAHTAHLEPMEDLAYRRMLDLYYRTEKPLPGLWADIARLIRLRDEGDAIQSVLDEFFVLTDEGWRHARCDAEIAKMQDKQAKAKSSARASANVRSANAQRTLSERSANAKPTLDERSAEAELPTPTPTPTPTENTRSLSATAAGRVCRAMKAEGISDPSPGHPDLLALIGAGATEAEFRHSAVAAVAKGKGFAYAIGTLKRQRIEAAALPLHQGAMPNPTRPLTPGEQRMLEAVPSLVSASVRQRATPPANRDVIDAEPTAASRILG